MSKKETALSICSKFAHAPTSSEEFAKRKEQEQTSFNDAKPCPFCGSESIVIYAWENDPCVTCDNCHTCGPRVWDKSIKSTKAAIKAWNTRKGK